MSLNAAIFVLKRKRQFHLNVSLLGLNNLAQFLESVTSHGLSPGWLSAQVTL